ncbi:hypothetical protein [Lacticaseibacillus paracasei]|uniref:hypothetical protein n=1 Tax=Lacticaseibacillus paracasei TaxID=1597 RepID=UPI002A5AC80C|nr:hypothetical protein [Lacticaseibacillus paracasei]MDY0837379.1 hypothetical protein [Lacticaseibacillus paracasei]
MNKKEHAEKQIQSWEENDKRKLQSWEELTQGITEDLKSGDQKLQNIELTNLYDRYDDFKSYGTLFVAVLVNTRDTPKDAPKD